MKAPKDAPILVNYNSNACVLQSTVHQYCERRCCVNYICSIYISVSVYVYRFYILLIKLYSSEVLCMFYKYTCRNLNITVLHNPCLDLYNSGLILYHLFTVIDHIHFNIILLFVKLITSQLPNL